MTDINLTPHGILEDIRGLEAVYGGELAECVDHLGWNDAKVKMHQAASFEFGEAFPEEAHSEFAENMLYRGMFRLPFPIVHFSSSIGFSIVAYDYEELGEYNLNIIEFNDISIDNQIYAYPFMTSNLKIDRAGYPRLLSQSIGRRRPFLPPDSLQEKYRQTTYHRLNFVWAMTALLMSKDVTTEIISAPDKLNRQRAKKGRLPIGERRIIRIRPEARERQRHAAEGFRSSPSMHWRRGHFRRISDEFVVPVAPTIVGARDDAKPTIKNYVFAAPASAAAANEEGV